MPPTTKQFRMADLLADGTLADFIVQHKADGHSFDQIGRLLFRAFGIEVTRQTLAVWHAVLVEEQRTAEPDAKAVS